MKKNKRYFKFTFLSFAIFFYLCGNLLFAGDTTRVSFMVQNKNHLYTSFSFGMGVDYSNNPSLKKYIQYTIPNYSTFSPQDQLSDFTAGLEFFAGVEKQIARNFSLKAEYSYFIKSYNVAIAPNYDFSYKNHQPFLIANYIFPNEYFYIKAGAGIGYILSDLTVKQFGGETNYTSTGIGLKLEGVLNAQISRNVAGYLSGFITNSILQNLKDKSGNELISSSGDRVNLSSFGVGLRLGVEVYIF
jgi:hypothetical protein